MLQKETQFDFSKESRKEPMKKDWSRFIKPTVNFTKKHKAWFMVGIGIFIAYQGLVYVVSDTPQETKTKAIALQTAASHIPDMIENIEKSKNSYDEMVNFLMIKEYEITTNSMRTMQDHSKGLLDLNIHFKKRINEQQEQLKIIDKKLKETKTFELLTSDEKEFLLEEYVKLKSNDTYYSAKLDEAINHATTTDLDEKPSDQQKINELQKAREEIKKQVSEIKKKTLKK